MTRRTYVYDQKAGEVVEKQKAVAAPRIHVIGDLQEPVQSMISGEMFSSKGSLRRHYRQHGVVEVGNEPLGKLEWGYTEGKE